MSYDGIDSLYDGTIGELEFPMAGNPSKLSVGDYGYPIFKDELRDRLQITELIRGVATNHCQEAS